MWIEGLGLQVMCMRRIEDKVPQQIARRKTVKKIIIVRKTKSLMIKF